MSAPRRFVLATGNRGKTAELAALLAAAGIDDIELVPQSALGVAGPPETGGTFVENALLKARHAAQATGLPALADDSGLLVDALHGQPGVHSARYAGEGASDAANVAKLLAALERVPAGRRAARFVCVLVALASADDPAPLLGVGEWRGEIALTPRGGRGFGYDPVFLDPASGLTAGELMPDEKNRRSHRALALRGLAAAWKRPR